MSDTLGLSSAQARERLRAHGANVLAERRKPLAHQLLLRFKNVKAK